ncbi:MAG: ABC transporter ATP-binding protein [Bacteroidales bacterium]|nr:ABC transporter ATP-binding protein [Bacteroidales bacterium]MBD5282316.1 ABC transporter ATP-binding protein [Bacteroides sp.]MBD5351611.1 ABC transporter ATP-binding protein [Bacteroides sp.]MBD5360403.1 ABC transporter ATP-binding protein [Bacteroides sp.]MDE6033296.1 ABC transporter ATP-binding protein [Muribaculaceae bacterium]
MNNSVISVRNLTKRFGSFTAVDHISFDVSRGEIFGFLGANGAGKTTAMRMLCGLSQPSDGTGLVAGFDIAANPEMVKRNIGYMSQKFSLYEDLSVNDNLTLFATIYGMKNQEIKKRKAELYDFLEMTDIKNSLVRDIPIGWKQRLAFAAATIHNPKVVFLDEPTGGVDPITRRRFWELIYKVSSEGMTVFVTTHYLDEAEYCNRVSIMVDGRIKALDSPDELKLKYGVETMDAVFRKVAEGAQRSE